MPNPPMRTIKHTSILIGDHIRVTAMSAGIQLAKTGTVRKRNHWDGNSEYATAEGGVLLTVYKDGTTDMSGTVTVSLLRRIDPDVLPGMGKSDTLFT